MAQVPPTFFVSFSAADDSGWIELFRCLTYGADGVAIPENEERAAKQRRTFASSHEHWVGALYKHWIGVFYMHRIEALFDIVFREGLGYKWDCSRLELTGDPDLTERAWAMVRGREVTQDLPAGLVLHRGAFGRREADDRRRDLYQTKLEVRIDAHDVPLPFQKLFLSKVHPWPRQPGGPGGDAGSGSDPPRWGRTTVKKTTTITGTTISSLRSSVSRRAIMGTLFIPSAFQANTPLRTKGMWLDLETLLRWANVADTPSLSFTYYRLFCVGNTSSFRTPCQTTYSYVFVIRGTHEATWA